jgi:hypothetical protein
MPVAYAEELTGDYQYIFGSNSYPTDSPPRKSISYRCNSLDLYAGGGILTADLTCNKLLLHASGRSAFQGAVSNVDIALANTRSKVYMNELAIETLHVGLINDRSMVYAKVSKSAQVDSVNGGGILYIGAVPGTSNTPQVKIDRINADSEVHWCGVSVKLGSMINGGPVIEDCSW